MPFPHRSKMLRTLAFVYPFIFDNIPLFHRLTLCCEDGCNPSETLFVHCYHLIFAFLTCFLFASHLPERLAPGHFDYIGHSHQLFHICAVVGTHFQMEALLTDMASRRAWLAANTVVPSFLGTVGAMALAVVLNLAVIATFSAVLLQRPSSVIFTHQVSAHKLKTQQRVNRNRSKYVVVMSLSYCICWFPFNIITLVVVFIEPDALDSPLFLM
ncbi:progestin and adipoQ receptor family member 6-like [Arapaima gigas]